MARNPDAYYSGTQMDYSGEKSTYTIPMRVYTAVAGQFDLDLVRLTSLKGTIDTITGGTLIRDGVTPIATKFDATAPTDVNAQRERKWVVSYQDLSTFQTYQVELPCASPTTARMLDGTDQADLTDSDMAAFVTAFEVFVDSPDNNGINVTKITLVGRNL